MTGGVFQTELKPDELALRDRFVSEYMKDFDAYKATIRTGFQPTFAVEWGKKLLGCYYVQHQIQNMLRVDSPEQDAFDKALLKNTYRRVMQTGSDSASVAAGRALAAMNGWEKPDPSQDAEQSLIETMKAFAMRAPV